MGTSCRPRRAHTLSPTVSTPVSRASVAAGAGRASCRTVFKPISSGSAAVTFLKKAGVTNMRFVCLVAAPEGIQTLHRQHPEVSIYTAAIDRQLNEKGYILPGLGDAGDRIFGT